MNLVCDDITRLSTAIRTTVLDDVNRAVEGLKCDLDGVLKYYTNIKEWLKPVVDLTDFHVYPMNGITQGLDWWYHQESRCVIMKPGDYQWISAKGGYGKIRYISVPSAIDGNFVDIPTDTPTAVDLAYVGSTRIKKIHIPKATEFVFYSFSKPFGVRNIRTGWIFTRKPDAKLEALTHSAKYYNYHAHNISETIISNFDIDYVYNQLKEKQKSVCEKYNFVPSDSVWLATTDNSAYDKFKRGERARLCLAPCY